jgi:hypothetical protein
MAEISWGDWNADRRKNMLESAGVTYQFLFFSAVIYSDVWRTSLIEYSEGEEFQVRLHLIVKPAAHEPLGVEYSAEWCQNTGGVPKTDYMRVRRIHDSVSSCGIADKASVAGERYNGGCGAVPFLIGDDLDLIIFPDPNTPATQSV